MRRVAVFGASGFVGTALVERLNSGGYDVRPLMHSGRNAWRLARLGVEMATVDVLNPRQVQLAIHGCTHVVNCILGNREAMLAGMQNILHACHRAEVRRLVHLSSITVYGESPLPESVCEDAAPRAARGTYGWIKWRQDQMVERAAQKGLSCAILCPPIVSGPQSTQLICLLDALARRRFALVDDGNAPCSLVDVENLAQAIQLALERKEVEARRLFIVDEQCATWRELIDSLMPIIHRWLPLPQMTSEQARACIAASQRVRLSPWSTIRRAASSETRRVMRADPLFASAERLAVNMARRVLSPQKWSEMRAWHLGAALRRPHETPPDRDLLFLSRQLRGVRHSCQRARERLGYAPELSFDASMQRFCDWYIGMRGWNDPHADLISQLESA